MECPSVLYRLSLDVDLALWVDRVLQRFARPREQSEELIEAQWARSLRCRPRHRIELHHEKAQRHCARSWRAESDVLCEYGSRRKHIPEQELPRGFAGAHAQMQ